MLLIIYALGVIATLIWLWEFALVNSKQNVIIAVASVLWFLFVPIVGLLWAGEKIHELYRYLTD